MSRRVRCGLLAACMLLSLLSGCGAKEAQQDAASSAFGVTPGSTAETDSAVEAQTAAGVITMPYNGSYGWDPYSCKSMENQAVMQLIYQGLFTLTPAYDAEPVLCEDYSVSDDGLTYTITLKNAYFSNGAALTAADVIYSFAQAAASELYQERFGDIFSYEATSGDTVVIHMNNPNDRLPCLLNFPIIPNLSTSSAEPAGTGPFIRTGETLVLDQNWWQGADTVRFQKVMLYSSASAEDTRDKFEIGAVDFVYNDPLSSTAAAFHCDYELWNSPNAVMQYIGFNTNGGLCVYKEIRTAIIRAIDRSSIAESVYHNFADPAALPVPVVSSLYDEALAQNYAYDAESALEQLLDSSAFSLPEDDPRLTGGPGAQRNVKDTDPADSTVEEDTPEETAAPDTTVATEGDDEADAYETLLVPDTTYNPLTMIVLAGNLGRYSAAKQAAEYLTDVGFSVTIKTLDEDQFFYTLNAGNYDLFYADVSLSPDLDLRSLLLPGGDLNYGLLQTDSTLETLFDHSLENSGNRYDLYQYVMDQGYLCPILFENNAVFATRGVISGLNPAPGNLFYQVENISVQ